MVRGFNSLVLSWCAWTAFSAVQASTFEVNLGNSLAGVVVYKTGIGSGLAHNHLIVAPSFTKIQFDIPDGKPLETGHFHAVAAVADLVVDDYANVKKWGSLLSDLGAASDDIEFKELDKDDRAKIRANMLADDQLDGDKFPSIDIELLSLAKAARPMGKVQSTHNAKLAITIHGVRKEVEFPARLEQAGDGLTVTTSGKLAFTQFGFEPVSAMLGAIRNKDEFQLVVQLSGRRLK